MSDYNPFGQSSSLIGKRLPKDGNMNWVVETGPETEPVSLAELKTFSRITTSAEDDLLTGFIVSARMAAEEYTGRAFIEQTIKALMDFWPGDVIDLPRPPLISITKVFTLDEDDAETEYSSSSYYCIPSAQPGKLIIKQSVSEPENTSRDYSGFGIRYKAGYGTVSSDVPEIIRDGIKLWAAAIYSTRVVDPKNPPPEAKSKLDLYRRSSLVVR